MPPHRAYRWPYTSQFPTTIVTPRVTFMPLSRFSAGRALPPRSPFRSRRRFSQAQPKPAPLAARPGFPGRPWGAVPNGPSRACARRRARGRCSPAERRCVPKGGEAEPAAPKLPCPVQRGALGAAVNSPELALAAVRLYLCAGAEGAACVTAGLAQAAARRPRTLRRLPSGKDVRPAGTRHRDRARTGAGTRAPEAWSRPLFVLRLHGGS